MTSYALALLATAVQLNRLLVFVFICLFVFLRVCQQIDSRAFLGLFKRPLSGCKLFFRSLMDFVVSRAYQSFGGIYLRERLLGYLAFGLFVFVCFFLLSVPPFPTVRKKIESILIHISPSVSGPQVCI